jgi:hypothetical protein
MRAALLRFLTAAFGTNRSNRPLADEAEIDPSRKVVMCEAIQASENKHGEQQGTTDFG